MSQPRTNPASEPDCLAGLLVALTLLALACVWFPLASTTPAQRQLLLDSLGETTGIVWIRPFTP